MIKFLLVATLSLIPSLSTAQGLICQLPPDGTWAHYDAVLTLPLRDGGVDEIPGSVIIRSVGESEDGSFRWLEIDQTFSMKSGARREIYKFRITETSLDRAGVNFLIYCSDDGRSPRVVDLESKPGPTLLNNIALFLQMDNKASIPSKEKRLETPIGVLNCVETAVLSRIIDPPSGVTYNHKILVYGHKNLPFGSAEYWLETSSSHELTAKAYKTKLKLVLAEVGRDAESSITLNEESTKDKTNKGLDDALPAE